MDVKVEDAEPAGLISEFGNTKYYFCCKHCKEQFDKAPPQYLENAGTGRQSHVHEGHEHD